MKQFYKTAWLKMVKYIGEKQQFITHCHVKMPARNEFGVFPLIGQVV